MKAYKSIASGKLFFKREGDSEYREIADVRDVKIGFTEETAKCFNNSSATETLVLEKIVKQDAEITYSTPTVDINNMSYFLNGKIESKVYAVGDTLPDMTIATQETTIESVSNAIDNTVIGAFKFIDGDFLEDENGEKFKKIFDVPLAQIKNDGGIDLMTKDFIKISYKGSALKLDNEPLVKISYQPIS